MRAILLSGILLFATAASAQPAPGSASPDQPSPATQGQPGATMPPRPHGGPAFDAANTTHDGRLTRDQAQAGGMGHIAQHFDEIDADHKGYVTKQDIRAWRRAKKAAKQARMQQSGQPGAYPPEGAAPGAAPPVGQEQPGPGPQ